MKKLKLCLLVIMFIFGLSILAYPTVANLVARYNQNIEIEKYDKETKKINKEIKEEALKKAKDYNDKLIGMNIKDPFIAGSGNVISGDYKNVLYFDRGMMGVLEIPAIDVKMPIYHGTSENSMRNGAGHIKETSVPIGGENTHSVLSSHRGLTSAKLFTDLDKVNLKDVFYIEILGDTHAYEVDQIKVVEPDNTTDLQVIKGKDYVTLLTCTPYSINSHRLLVRGHRIPYVEKQEVVKDYTEFIWIAVFIVAGIVLVLIRYCLHMKKRKQKIRKIKV